MPKCSRSYGDDLVFCLEDGSRLSRSNDPNETVRLPQPPTVPFASIRPAAPPASSSNNRLLLFVIVILAVFGAAVTLAFLYERNKSASGASLPTSTQTAPQSKPGTVRANPESRNGIFYNGVYRYDAGSYTYWMRFTDDGTVEAVTTSNTLSPSEAAEKLQNSNTGKGHYTVQNSNIEFRTESSSGAVSYKGRIEDKALDIEWHSYINGADGHERYGFVSIE